MKMPNGYGTVYRLSGNRRNPYRAVVTTGWKLSDGGRAVQERRTLGYYRTKKDALNALASYNSNPYDLSGKTFAQVYEAWRAEHEPTLAPGSARQYASAYSYCTDLYEKQMKEIKLKELEAVIALCPKSAVKSKIRLLFSQVYKYAMRHEIIQKDYARLLQGASYEVQKQRIPFAEDEIRKLYETVREKDGHSRAAVHVLIGIYTGWRPSELLAAAIEDGIMRGGMKTKAGRNRIVPVHKGIMPLLEQFEPYKNYDSYRYAFEALMKALGMKHMPHDTRHTFATLCDEYSVRPEVARQLLGHSTGDITEMYTHRAVSTLREEIEKIRVCYL